MIDILKIFGKRTTPSKNIARERLKLLLMTDRTDCSPKMLEMLKSDIIKVISNYMDIDETDMDIQIQAGDAGENTPMLFANIPIRGVRKRAGG